MQFQGVIDDYIINGKCFNILLSKLINHQDYRNFEAKTIVYSNIYKCIQIPLLNEDKNIFQVLME